MASPGINSIVEAEQRPDHRDVCASHYELRHQLIGSGQFRGNRRRDTQTELLRRLMAAVLSEAVNRFERNLFQTSLYGRCEFVEAEFWLFKDESEALFSFNNVCDFLSLDPRHIRRRLCDWHRSQTRAANSTDATTKTPTSDLNDGPMIRYQGIL
jgi:hypothetical protein